VKLLIMQFSLDSCYLRHPTPIFSAAGPSTHSNFFFSLEKRTVT